MGKDLLQKTSQALVALAGKVPLRDGAVRLLNTLGYASSRTADVGNVREFCKSLGSDKRLTEKQNDRFNDWRMVEIVFQVTSDEIELPPDQRRLLDGPGFDQGRAKSFLFLAVDMRSNTYPRTYFTETTRAVNRLFRMPVIVLFRYDSVLTLAAIHRRANKQDDDRDVLEKVTLVKDIHLVKPHRAHIEILAELSLNNMIRAGVRNFDDLHAKWERVLSIETLNERFYTELFSWFERATVECRFPDDGAGDGCEQRQVIRLITRILFIWFLREKDLVPSELFEEHFARDYVKDHTPENTNYYQAVLQNLFFATLNTEIEERAFNIKSSTTHRDFNKYCYRNLLHRPDDFIERLKQVPFVNGGLFDCLDDSQGSGHKQRQIDAFTDDMDIQGHTLQVPSRLLLDEEEGLFALFRRYKFTIEESTPLDTEVALDPELLGRVFENLLAAYDHETSETARKNTGSYYTPRPVVDYMIHEAVANALAAKVRPTSTPEEHWRDKLGYLLDWQDKKADARDFFDADETQSVVAAISELRTLDPAVGSGAFPMAILQTLTLALRRLDPDNTLWEAFQKERAANRAGQAFDTKDQQERNDILAEISDTFEKYRHTDFGRKLYLIQNVIYGVDIQPIACQIAKLRFFISLTIEQNKKLHAPNYGIRPLPNLETRLLAANSLLRLKRLSQSELGRTQVISVLERELATNRERHFLAGYQSEKVKVQESDKRLRTQLASQLQQSGFPANTAERISKWNPYDQNGIADWFDPEYMFGVTDGFDIVIGNPPYIQLQKDGSRAGNLYSSEPYQTYRRSGDIYQLFYERGCKLLRPQSGILCYITSNSWLKAKYGKPLRQWFADHHSPLQLIELGKDIFENAIVDTAVLIIRNGKGSSETCLAVDVEEIRDNRFPPPKEEWGTLKPIKDRPWTVLSSTEQAVMEKMEAIGTPLCEWDISIYRGIVTGYNPAFIVDSTMRDQLIAEDPASEEILKPILRGRDIGRYSANWSDLWLISTFPALGLDIDAYPAIKRYLLSFGRERLAQEGRLLPGGGRSRSKTPYAWYELQSTCAYHAQFCEEKLFWMDLTPEGRFSYSPAGAAILCANSAYFMHGILMKQLAAFLNSSLITWYVNKTATTSGMGTSRWFTYVVKRIPVPKPIPNSCYFESLVNDLLRGQKGDNHESDYKARQDIEMTIEALVHESYGITKEETKKLENQLGTLQRFNLLT